MRLILWTLLVVAFLGEANAQEQQNVTGACQAPYNKVPRGLLSWDRVRNNLEKEWMSFGYRTVDYTANKCSVSKRGKIEDDDIGTIEDVMKYWRAVGQEADDNYVRCEKAPWSAAFISWIFIESGATFDRGDGQGDICPHSGHAVYVWHMSRQKRLRTQGLPFLVFNARSMQPEIGDLICSNRDGSRFQLENYLNADGSPIKAHCDIVVGKGQNVVRAIGGNAQDGVTMSIVPVNSSGLLLDTPGWRDWKVVVRPPFEGAIAPIKVPTAAKFDLVHGKCYEDRRLVRDARLHPADQCEPRDPKPNY